ncbi:MAG: hypothetical protein ABSB35_18920 [Bryobacteraceae bacterium]|jgi:hypothetical protein
MRLIQNRIEGHHDPNSEMVEAGNDALIVVLGFNLAGNQEFSPTDCQ